MAATPIVSLHDLNAGYPQTIEDGLRETGFFDQLPAGAPVFLKPNLTFPVYRPGVMTSFECLKAVTTLLIGKGYPVIIGEADSGGYNRFSIDEVFKGMGIDKLAQETGARLVNLSFTEPEWLEVRAGFRRSPSAFRFHQSLARQVALKKSARRLAGRPALARACGMRPVFGLRPPGGQRTDAPRHFISHRRRRDIFVDHPATKNHKLRRSDIGNMPLLNGAFSKWDLQATKIPHLRRRGLFAYGFLFEFSRKAIGEGRSTSAAEPVMA
ncbi:MAG: DUF362 domain-containing protein [Verrucomicrobia bacterium]|nr:DUF362 domain-containing protein [Verrucomicrobiota bacterium]